MGYIVMRHRVADFARWKPVFDEYEPLRRENGWIGHTICRDETDPNLVVVIGRVKDLKRAKDLLRSETVRSAQKAAGVQGQPEIWSEEAAEEKSY